MIRYERYINALLANPVFNLILVGFWGKLQDLIFRSRLVEDGYRQLSNLSSAAMKGLIRVKFVNLQVIFRFMCY